MNSVNLNKDIKMIKTKQLEIKNTITEMKNSLEGISHDKIPLHIRKTG